MQILISTTRPKIVIDQGGSVTIQSPGTQGIQGPPGVDGTGSTAEEIEASLDARYGAGFWRTYFIHTEGTPAPGEDDIVGSHALDIEGGLLFYRNETDWEQVYDFASSGGATAEQGAKADTALQPGVTITLAQNTSLALNPAGSADGTYCGITHQGIGGAMIAFGDLVTLDKDDGRWEKVDIAVAAAATGDARGILGIAVTASTDGAGLTVLLHGNVRADANFPTLAIGAAVFASTTGDITSTKPSASGCVIRVVGHALAAHEIFFNPSNTWFKIN